MIRYIQARVSVHMYTRIKTHAAKHNMTVEDIIKDSIEKYLTLSELVEDGFKDTSLEGLTKIKEESHG